MEIEKLLQLFREYVDKNKIPHYPSIELFRDGSGCFLDINNRPIHRTNFKNLYELYDLLSPPTRTELEEAEDKYLSELRKFYPQGTKIKLVVRGQNVEVTVDKP